MEVSGTVILTDLQKGVSKSGKEWQKKNFVLSYNEGMIEKKLAFEIFGEDKINANPVKKGQKVTVLFDIESTEWNGRWFTTLKATNVSKLGEAPKVEAIEQPMFDNNPEDNLPF